MHVSFISFLILSHSPPPALGTNLGISACLARSLPEMWLPAITLKMLVVFHWLRWCMALWLVNIILFARSVEASVNTQSFVPDLSGKTWACVIWLLLGVRASEIGLRERLRACNCACLSVHQLWFCLMCSHSEGKTVSFASQALFMGLWVDLNRCWNFLSSWYWELQTDKTWEQ